MPNFCLLLLLLNLNFVQYMTHNSSRDLCLKFHCFELLLRIKDFSMVFKAHR